MGLGRNKVNRRTDPHSLILTSAMGILAMIEAYVIPGIVPSP